MTLPPEFSLHQSEHTPNPNVGSSLYWTIDGQEYFDWRIHDLFAGYEEFAEPLDPDDPDNPAQYISFTVDQESAPAALDGLLGEQVGVVTACMTARPEAAGVKYEFELENTTLEGMVTIATYLWRELEGDCGRFQRTVTEVDSNQEEWGTPSEHTAALHALQETAGQAIVELLDDLNIPDTLQYKRSIVTGLLDQIKRAEQLKRPAVETAELPIEPGLGAALGIVMKGDLRNELIAPLRAFLDETYNFAIKGGFDDAKTAELRNTLVVANDAYSDLQDQRKEQASPPVDQPRPLSNPERDIPAEVARLRVIFATLTPGRP